MPARLARSSVQVAAPKNARNKNRKRNLDAYSIASHQVKEKRGLKASRFGEFLDDEPKQKRRRAVEDEDDEESVEEDVPARGAKRQRAAADNDEIEQGSDSEGNEWTLGGLGSEDDDSDLDSDEAFGESDEEKFEGFTFRGSSGRKKALAQKPKLQRKGQPEIDLHEQGDEDEEDMDEDGEDFGDEGVDLATMLDDQDEEMLGEKDNTREDLGEESEEDEEVDESDDSDEDDEDHDMDGADEERVARLRDRLEAMDQSSQTSKPKSSQATALSVDDLLADLDPSTRKQFSAAVKTKKKSEAPKTLAAPLPKRQQDKIDREVASQKAKEQLDRWRDTVIQNRQAEHLSFPLKNPDGEGREGADKFVVDNRPKNELEENIRKIMLESGMISKPGEGDDQPTGDDALMKAEELATNKLPVEEVERRRAELRKARELLFREEIKAKRIAKIKSKSYRRVHRKEKERQNQLEREAREAAGLDGMDEDEKERADRLRAEERMSTKHRDSKWAKTLKATNRTAWDEGARDSVMEQARRNEELRRRIAGENVAGGEGSEFSDDEDYGDEGNDDEDTVMRGRLERLKQDVNDGEGKGLRNLKFMRNAEERQRARNNEDIERLRKELAVQDGDENESGDEINDQGLGRAIFGPKGRERQNVNKKTKRPEMEEGDLSGDDEGEDHREPDIVLEQPQATSEKPKQKAVSSGPLAKGSKQNARQSNHSDNPWIDGSNAEPARETDWLGSRPKSKKEQQRSRALNDHAALDLDLSKTDTAPNKRASAASSNKGKRQPNDKTETQDTAAGNTDGWTLVTYKDDDDTEDNSDAESETHGQPVRSQQSAYHARAFAGDDVEAAFQAEKDEAIASEDEKEVSNHLPGWGSWTGEGLSSSIRKSNAKQRHNPLWKHRLAGVKPSERQDANLERVIISQKKDSQGGGKKSGKYLASVLPHGFDRKDQYERSLRLPVGPEWVTRDIFNKNTKPRVLVKPGRVIEAMEKPMV